MTRSEFEHGWTSSGFGTSTEADTLFAALDTDHDGRITASHDLNSRFTALDVNREFLMFFSGFFLFNYFCWGGPLDKRDDSLFKQSISSGIKPPGR